jgi:hypothetical protein
MTKQILVFISLIISILIFTGCANKIEVKPNNVIKDISKLKQSTLNENTYYYIKKGTDFSKYNNIIVPEITVYMAKDKENVNKVVEDISNYFTDNVNNEVDKKLLDDISLYFTKNLQKNIQEIVENKRFIKRSLEIQASIVSLNVSYDNLEFYQFLPYGLAFTAIKRSTGFEDKKLRVNFALKVIDKKTKETLALLLEHEVLDSRVNSSKKLTIKDIQPILDKWINKYSIRLKEIKEGKYKNLSQFEVKI